MLKRFRILFGPVELIVGVLSLVVLYAVSRYSYPVFHMLAELFSIVIGFGLFMLIWNSRRIIDNNYLIFIGIAYFFVAGIDLVHALAYKGMDVFAGYGANLPTQLWIAARYLEAFSLFVAPFLIRRKLGGGYVFWFFASIFLLLLAAIFSGLFPDCYIEGTGLTPFKIVSEYVICVILLCALALLLGIGRELDRKIALLLCASIILTIASELSFTFYIGVYDISNLIGHFFKIISFFLIYKAVIEMGLTKPYDLMFRNLKQAEEALRAHRDRLEFLVEARTAELKEINANLLNEIGKRKEAEAEIRKLNEELEQRVMERTAELEAANKDLDDFTYTVSHDLRAPLRAIDGFSRMLLRSEKDTLKEETLRKLNVIRQNVQAMGQLIDDLLAFSRLGRAEVSPSEIDMTGLVKELWGELTVLHDGHQVELRHGALPPASGDRMLMKQALSNLLSNALKYSRTREHPIIEIGGAKSAVETVYYVKDNGVGFDMRFYEKLFGVFQRLHTDAEFEGTGVGLAIVQRIVQRHGGSVWAEGKMDGGATFYFRLPVKQERTPPI